MSDQGPGDRGPGDHQPGQDGPEQHRPGQPSQGQPSQGQPPQPSGPDPTRVDPSTLPPPAVDPSTLPPPSVGTAGGPQATGGPPAPAAQPATSGWYNGPLPIAGLAPRETVGSAIGRTAVKAITAVVIFGAAFVLIPLLFIAVIGAIVGSAAGDLEQSGQTRSLVAGESNADISLVMVSVEGLILGEDRGGGGLFAPTNLTYGYTIQEELAELAEDDSVDGVILEINSPGGTIFGSKAIADGVAAYRDKTGKPVVAYVSGISASGGMYAMAGADAIYADHGTLIGSIGVIFGPFVTYDDVRAIDGGILGGGVTTEGGIEFEFLTAGRSKDFGNPYREMTEEERTVLQEGLDDAYDEFVVHVAKGRDLSESDIKDGLGALIFGEQQAVANGLIDGISNRNDSFERAAVAAGMTDSETYKVERLDSGSDDFFSLFASRVSGADDQPEAGVTTNPLSAEPMCLGAGAIMAYHGDPAMLCTPGS